MISGKRRVTGLLLFSAGLGLIGVRPTALGRTGQGGPGLLPDAAFGARGGRGEQPDGDGAAGLRPVILLAAVATVAAVNAREVRRQRAVLAAVAPGGNRGWVRDREPGSSRRLARTCLPAAMAAIVVSELLPAAGAGRRASRAALAAGLAVTTAGVAVRQRAIGTLGRFYTGALIIQPGHRLIQAGPYQVIRHPGYAGIWLQVAGIGLASGNAAGLAICLLLPAAGIVPRIRAEDALLAGAFSGQFPHYAASTRRLVPYAW